MKNTLYIKSERGDIIDDLGYVNLIVEDDRGPRNKSARYIFYLSTLERVLSIHNDDKLIIDVVHDMIDVILAKPHYRELLPQHVPEPKSIKIDYSKNRMIVDVDFIGTNDDVDCFTKYIEEFFKDHWFELFDRMRKDAEEAVGLTKKASFNDGVLDKGGSLYADILKRKITEISSRINDKLNEQIDSELRNYPSC